MRPSFVLSSNTVLVCGNFGNRNLHSLFFLKQAGLWLESWYSNLCFVITLLVFGSPQNASLICLPPYRSYECVYAAMSRWRSVGTEPGGILELLDFRVRCYKKNRYINEKISYKYCECYCSRMMSLTRLLEDCNL